MLVKCFLRCCASTVDTQWSHAALSEASHLNIPICEASRSQQNIPGLAEVAVCNARGHRKNSEIVNRARMRRPTLQGMPAALQAPSAHVA